MRYGKRSKKSKSGRSQLHKRKSCAKSWKKRKDLNKSVLTAENIDIGYTVFATCQHHETVKNRPFLVWSLFFDENMKVIGVEGLVSTASFKFVTPSEVRAVRLLDRGGALTEGKICVGTGDFLRNDPRIITYHPSPLVNNSNLDIDNKKLIPDLVLRRSIALCKNFRKEATCIQPRSAMRKIAVRKGIVLPELKFNEGQDVRFNGDYGSPGLISDAIQPSLKQLPFVVPEYLEQGDVTQILYIANNYHDYCKARHKPIIWPEVRQWKRWPEEFMKFAEPQDPQAYKTPWFDEGTPCSEERGFAVNYHTYQTDL